MKQNAATKRISRVEFAKMMADAANTFPSTSRKRNSDGIDHDQKYNDWHKAAEILTSVGQPFASCADVDFKEVRLTKMADIPKFIKTTVYHAMHELEVNRVETLTVILAN